MLLANFRHLHCDEVLTLKLDLPTKDCKKYDILHIFIFIRVATERFFGRKDENCVNIKMHPKIAVLKQK